MWTVVAVLAELLRRWVAYRTSGGEELGGGIVVDVTGAVDAFAGGAGVGGTGVVFAIETCTVTAGWSCRECVVFLFELGPFDLCNARVGKY